MNQHLKTIQDLLQQNKTLSDADKEALLKSIVDADKQWSITDFKLDRTEKVKKTTAILLEETIEELEQKRKAVEAQNRELEIESSLEKVRTVAMGMRKRDDMLDICQTMSKQLESLGIKEIRNVQTAIFYKDKGIYVNYEYYRLHDKALVTDVDYTADQLSSVFAAHMMKGPDEFFTRSLAGKEVQAWYDFQKTTNVFIDTYLATATSLSYYWFSLGPVALGLSSYVPLSEGDLNLFKRFRNVFGLAYQRYIDIEKAEAQAREARIEAALEKVRSRSLAMHKSDELREVVAVVFEKLKQLDFGIDGAAFIAIPVLDADYLNLWIGDDHAKYPSSFKIPHYDEPVITDIRDAVSSGLDFFSRTYSFEEKNKWFNYAFANTDVKTLPEQLKQWILEQQFLTQSFALGKNSMIGIHFHYQKNLSVDEIDTLKRFSNVFEQSYVRFLDLQKAEARSREAKIEAALERTRTQSMIMQHSKELDDTLRVFHEQVLLLGIQSAFSFLWLPDEEKDRHIFWAAWREGKNGLTAFKSKAINYPLDRNEPATAQCLVDWKSNEPIVSYHVPPSGVEKYFAAWQELIDGVEQLKPEYFSAGLYYVEAFMKYGCFGVMVVSDLTEDEKKILGRFAIEFERTYTRFLDLQKAEAQAREAQIEAALERVRSRTMGMQKSDELRDVAVLLYRQFLSLGVTSVLNCGYVEVDEIKNIQHGWMTKTDGSPSEMFHLPLIGDPVLQQRYDSWKRRDSIFHQVVGSDKLKKHIDFTRATLGSKEVRELVVTKFPDPTIFYCGNFSNGYLHIITGSLLSKDEENLLERFTRVFEQTYTRFLDLQKAEAQSRESQIEAALERVRSRTLAMQKSDELAETAAVLFQQLIALGIEPNRLYISIVKDEKGETEFWITDEDGSKVSTAYTANLNDNPTFSNMYEGWKQQRKSLVIDMQGEELQAYFKHLTSIGVPFKGGLTQKRRVQDIAYFSKGFIGMASPDEQPPETLQLLERFAYVFNLTFTRFSDLQIAEAHALQAEKDLVAIKEAKQKAEEALTELQATQKQLIQSEKMASLGELTAGIAHEIQNPLNFVNNFSDVSSELLDEMKEELATGNVQQAMEIADDVKQNLEKILHHGKRADGIVKGMLQHSRTGSGQKELTDINALCDEYLRLAYHGLRAKDKSFNATLNHDFDKSIDKINVIPQDIGRVFVNLINNAFYAVNEKAKHASTSSAGQGYEPAVTVTTKKIGDKVELRIIDNGNGIPKKVLDKIFQPFFTTKPTGQGTGLGLSLAYDIITKGHSGELKVETKEGGGSEFIISLPSA